MRFGSVCSGIEAASVAWHPLGWQAAWFAEVDQSASLLLAHRFPDVPNYGDMTKLAARVRAREIEAPDVLVGGTPCQSFSIAGLRGGLSDERGLLTLAFVDLANAIDEVRREDDLEPAIIVWENVPGALNHADNPLGCFLGALAGNDEPLEPGPRPDCGRSAAYWTWDKASGQHRAKWPDAGCAAGPERAVAWIVKDAQYFGLAQRRRRVFVVASARTRFDPPTILFEFDGVRRDTAPSREAREGVTRTAAPSLDGCCASSTGGVGGGRVRHSPVTFDRQSNCEYGNSPIASTISARDYKSASDLVVELIPLPFTPSSFANYAEGIGTLRANGGDYRGGSETLLVHRTAQESFTAQSVSLRGRDGGGSAELGDDVAGCLRASGGGGDKPHVLVPRGMDVFPINTQMALRGADTSNSSREGVGLGKSGDPSSTLQAAHHHAVAMVGVGFSGDVAGTLTSRNDGSPCVDRGPDVVTAFHPTQDPIHSVEISHAIGTGSTGGQASVAIHHPQMAVRRLMPVECERLQGFPDNWTLVPNARGKPAADGPRYKQLGNSMAVNVMFWIGKRIDDFLKTSVGHNGGPPLDEFDEILVGDFA